MPFATNDGVRIRYEVEGSGPPLVLHIGFLGSLEDWSRADTRYTEALRDTFRLILLDPRGQGRSDAPHDPASYTLEARAGDVIAVLDALGIDRAHFWGYSMGGSVGFMLAARHPARLHSLIAGGANPWWEAPPPDEDTWYRWMEHGMEGFVAEFERQVSPMPAPARERWLALDAEALRASMRAPDRAAELTQALPEIAVPSLLYAGTNDGPEPIARAAELMPSATFISLEELNHAQAFRRSDLIVPHVRRFLDGVTRA